MKSLLELKAQLKVKRERFNEYRIENISNSILNENVQAEAQVKAQVKITDKIKGKIQEKIQEKVGEMKRFNRTMKQGYFTRPRSTGRTYKAMI